jgi:hypothetical protein
MAEPGPLTAEDRFAILELYARYAWAMDSGNVDAYVSLFRPDCILDLGSRHHGQEGVREWHTNFLKDSGFPGSQHFASQWIMEGNTEKAQTRAYVARLHRLPDTTSSQILWQGYYTDTVVKVDGRWQFQIKKSHWAEDLRRQDIGQGEYPGEHWTTHFYDLGPARPRTN